jgi:hypothetical protein
MGSKFERSEDMKLQIPEIIEMMNQYFKSGHKYEIDKIVETRIKSCDIRGIDTFERSPQTNDDWVRIERAVIEW